MGFFLQWADRLEEFRASIDQLYERAVSQGDESSIPVLLKKRCFVEISLGNLAEAKRLMERGPRSLAAAGRAGYLAARCSTRRSAGCSASLIGRATRGSGRSRSAEADRPRTGRGSALSACSGSSSSRSAVRPRRTTTSLGPWRAPKQPGSASRASAASCIDDVEALIALGRVDEAAALLEPLEELALALDRPTARGRCGRCRGLLLAAQRRSSGRAGCARRGHRAARACPAAVRARALAPRSRRDPAPGKAESSGARDARACARHLRPCRRRPLGGEGPDRARADRRTRRLALGADPDRGEGRRPRRRRPHQPRSRRRAVHERSHRRLEPPQDLRQARHPLPPRARGARAPATGS